MRWRIRGCDRAETPRDRGGGNRGRPRHGWRGKRAQVFTGADARRLASLAPSRSGWRWPQKRCQARLGHLSRIVDERSAPGAVQAQDSDSEVPRRGVEGMAGHRQTRQSRRRCLRDLLCSTRGDGLRSTSSQRAWLQGADGSGRQQKVDHLGDEAWVMWVSGNGAQVTYHWRRDNLVFETHVHCFGNCPPDVAALTRTWAETIDVAARTGP